MLDPYFGGMFPVKHAESWITRELMTFHPDLTPPQYRIEAPDAVAALLASPTLTSQTVEVLGFISAWRSATTEQIAAGISIPHLANPNARLYTLMLCAGLLERGTIIGNALVTRKPLDKTQTVVWQLGQSYHYPPIEKHLTWAQRIAINGARPLDAIRQYPRHNILTTQLALTAAGNTPWCELALGEQWGKTSLLVGEESRRSTADAVLVRADGLRVAIEMCASSLVDKESKFTAWARLFAQHSYKASGLVVVFVAAPKLGGRISMTQMMAAIKGNIHKATEQYPGIVSDLTANRMGVIAWDEWFGPDGPLPALAQGQCWFESKGSWHPRNLTDLPELKNGDLRAVLAAQEYLAGVLPKNGSTVILDKNLAQIQASRFGFANLLKV